jgi:cellobiose transport system permease protein
MSALIPNITSVAAVAIIFSQLFGRDYGLINWVLGLFGIDKVDWTANTWSAHIAVSTMIIWRWTGYNALIYLAAMQAVPKELYDSASLDGATSFQQLRKITVPAIRPTIIFTVIISTIGGMQVLAEPLLFGGNGLTGGSDRQFQTLALYLYEVAFGRFDFGYASASSWVMFLIIVIVAAINFGIISRLRRS